jgi:photoactive yellow protein
MIMGSMLQNRMAARSSAFARTDTREAAPAPAAMPSGPVAFVPEEILANLGSFTREQADACDFGVTQVDDAGRILLYNRYQSALGNVPVHAAEGQNFFTQLAPCTNNAIFAGTFRKGIAEGSMNVIFAYTFTFRMRPTGVWVHLYRCPTTRTNWLFIRRAMA